MKRILLMLFVLIVSIASAQTVFVDPVNGNDANDGSTWSLAKKTIMNAIWNAPGVTYDASVSDILVYVKEGTAVETPNTYESPDGLTFASAGIVNLYTTLPARKNITVQGSISSSATGTSTGDCGYVPPSVSLLHVTRVTLSDTAQQGLFRLFGSSGNLTLKGLYYLDFDGALENFGAVVGARDTYSNKIITVEDCVIDNCRVGVSTTPIELSDDGVKGNIVNIKNCIFRNNSEGVMRQNSNANTWNIENCKFDSNLQYGTFSQFQMETTGTTPSTLNILNSTFCNNTTAGVNLHPAMLNLFGAGGWIANIETSKFYGNKSEVAGGAIKVSNTALTLTENIFANNLVINRGGAIHLSSSTLTSSNNEFQYNKADQLTEGFGGAVYITGIKTGATLPAFTFSEDHFYNNTASQDGGAVYIEGQNSGVSPHITFDLCKFGTNAADDGGAIYAQADLQVTNSTFYNNTADNKSGGGLGGGIYSDNSATNLLNNCFSENKSSDGGAALYVTGGSTTQYFSLPSGYTASNGATNLRHIAYNNEFYQNKTGYSFATSGITGDDGVIGGAVVYDGVRATANNDEKGGNIAFVKNRVFNNITYYSPGNEINSVVASGFTLRGLSLSSDGDNVVNFQDNEFAGNTIGPSTSGGTQSTTTKKVDVAITNANGNIINYDGAIFNIAGTKFQLSASEYPILSNPTSPDLDWEGITSAQIFSGDTQQFGVRDYNDITSVRVLLDGVEVLPWTSVGQSNNQVALQWGNEDVFKTIGYFPGSGNNGSWTFTAYNTGVQKSYQIQVKSTSNFWDNDTDQAGPFTLLPNPMVITALSATPSFSNTVVIAPECSITTVQITECPVSPIVDVSTPSCLCTKDPKTTGTSLETKHGITTLQRAGVDNGNWPMVRKGAWTALESKTKGFVITRVDGIAADTSTNAGQPTGISNPQEGMMIYDIVNKCLKIYDGTKWSCFSKPGCPTP